MIWPPSTSRGAAARRAVAGAFCARRSLTTRQPTPAAANLDRRVDHKHPSPSEGTFGDESHRSQRAASAAGPFVASHVANRTGFFAAPGAKEAV